MQTNVKRFYKPPEKNKKKQTPKNLLFAGAEDEIRTRDPRLGKAMLYH